MGVCHIPEIFQEKIYEPFIGFEMIREYIDNLLIITNKYLTDYLNSLEKYYRNSPKRDYR